MKSKITILNLMVLFLLAAVLTCSAAGATDDQVIVLGRDGVYDLHTAMQSLSQNAGNAVIYLNGPVTLNRQLEIPIGLTGLKSVTLASYDGEPVQISMGGSVICANGIPLTLEKGVNLNNGFLVGGYCVGQYDTETAEDSLLIINGFAEYVIGGGLAMNPGLQWRRCRCQQFCESDFDTKQLRVQCSVCRGICCRSGKQRSGSRLSCYPSGYG